MHKGIGGVDRRYRPERVIETLAHYQPDVVFLQEADDGVPRTRGHRQVDLVGDALGLPHRAFQQNVKLRQGGYGNAILSRFPLSDVSDLDLTVPMKKRRQALLAHCRLHEDQHVRTVLIGNFHLGLAGYERTLQIRRFLRSHVLRHTAGHTPVIVGGDFNDVYGTLGRRLLEPQGFARAVHRIRTFPAAMPLRLLDWIYYRGDVQLIHSFAARTAVARRASDHLPIIAEFDVQRRA
jgi:endonuclease/exonuclease/phosphatase family metal-dependent hydrolase